MIRAFTLLFIGILFSIVLYKSYQYDNLFRVFIFSILGVIWFIVFIYTILKDKRIFRTNKKIFSYLPSVIGILSFLMVIGVYSFYENKLISPSLIKAQNHGIYADFKLNGEYIIKSGSWASRTHFYGNYSINDSIIILEKTLEDEILMTNRLLIRKEIDSAQKWKSHMIAIDSKGLDMKNRIVGFNKNGKRIYESCEFEITIDNRK